MRSIEFRYAIHKRRDIPLIPVSLRTGGKWKEVWAYIDSGSFYTIFDDKVAEILDIDLTSGEKVSAVVGDGGFIPIYLHTVYKNRRGRVWYEDRLFREIGSGL